MPLHKRQRFLEPVPDVHGLKDVELLAVAGVDEGGEEVSDLVVWNGCKHPLRDEAAKRYPLGTLRSQIANLDKLNTLDRC